MLKKVLLIIPHRSGKGGVASYWNGLIPHLENKEMEFTIFEMGGQTGGGMLHYFSDQLRFWRVIATKQFDVAHLNPSLDIKSFVRELLFIIALRVRGVKFMLTFHGWEVPLARKIQNGWKWLVKSTYLQSRVVNVLSTQFVQPLKDWGYKGAVEVQTTCVDTELIKDISVGHKHISADSQIKVLYISRIVKTKGVLETIQAMEIIASSYDVQLTIAGDGPYFSEVKKYVSERELSFVKLLGYVAGPAKKKLFESHQVLCFPTYYPEGLPVSIMEGISTGCVLVCTDVGGIADIFLDGKMGSICRPKPEDVAVKLCGWMDNPEEMNKVMDFNYGYGKSHFGADVVAEKIYQQYLAVS